MQLGVAPPFDVSGCPGSNPREARVQSRVYSSEGVCANSESRFTGPRNDPFRVRSASMPGNGLEYASEGGAQDLRQRLVRVWISLSAG